MIAVAAPIIFGSAALVIDTSLWFAEHAAAQTAADAGALAAARDLAADPSETYASPGVKADAVASANVATNSAYTLAGSSVSVNEGRVGGTLSPRAASVLVSDPGRILFSGALGFGPVNVPALANAGSGLGVSTQATCYSSDSYTYLFSTGVGTVDTAHSSGVDPTSCGTFPTPPIPYDAYCNGGITGWVGCVASGLTLGLVNLGFVLPLSVQISSTNGNGIVNLQPILAPLLGTVQSLLVNLFGSFGGFNNLPATLYVGVSGVSTASTVYVPAGGSYTIPNSFETISCTGKESAPVCTVPGGVYGTTVIGPNVTVNFTGLDYLFYNGNLVLSIQNTALGSNENSLATFYFAGTTPGALVLASQQTVNSAPVTSGMLSLSSTATFSSISLAGAEISSPLSAVTNAQTRQLHGITGIVGLPAGDILGTNFTTVVATCPNGVSICTNPQNIYNAFQFTLLPSVGALLSAIQPLVNLIAGATDTQLLFAVLNQAETSHTTITTTSSFQNGSALNWTQEETANSTLGQNINTLASSVVAILNSKGNIFIDAAVATVAGTLGVATQAINAVLSLLGLANMGTQNQDTGLAYGTYPGNTGLFVSPACPAGAPAPITNTYSPSFGVNFSNLLQQSNDTNNLADSSLVTSLVMADTLTVCGISSSSTVTTTVTPETQLTTTTSAGSTAIYLSP